MGKNVKHETVELDWSEQKPIEYQIDSIVEILSPFLFRVNKAGTDAHYRALQAAQAYITNGWELDNDDGEAIQILWSESTCDKGKQVRASGARIKIRQST